jgi:hypothetical protein
MTSLKVLSYGAFGAGPNGFFHALGQLTPDFVHGPESTLELGRHCLIRGSHAGFPFRELRDPV